MNNAKQDTDNGLAMVSLRENPRGFSAVNRR